MLRRQAMKWDKFNCEKNPVNIEDAERRIRTEEVKRFLENHPDRPFYFSFSGDCLVVGFNYENGEIAVYDTVPLMEYTAERTMESGSKIVIRTVSGTGR
jgi:hypothetical protein